MKRDVYIAGGINSQFLGRNHPDFIWKGHPDFGKRTNPGLEDYIGETVRDALKATGVDASQVERGFLSNFLGELFVKQGHMGAMVAHCVPELDGVPFVRTEAACASGAMAVVSAAEAIAAGTDVALLVGVEIETTTRSAEGIDYMNRAAHMVKDTPLNHSLFPYFFARRAKAYTESTDSTLEDLDRVVLKAYGNAKSNPKAQMNAVNVQADKLRDDTYNKLFLDDEELRPYIRMFDCTTFTDGASCIVLLSEDGLKKCGIPKDSCTKLAGYGMSTRALHREADHAFMDNMHNAAQRAYKSAGWSPKDVEIAEVHDCFSPSEIQMYEALGFADRGHGFELLRDGTTSREGSLPVNTGGGLLGFGHPIGATGIKQVLEIYRQMKGQSGDYQLANPPSRGASANLGGDDCTGVVLLQENI